MNASQDQPLKTATPGIAQDKPSTAEQLLVAKPWELVNVSRAHWCRLEVAGKTPAAIRLGRKKLYRRRDLALWIEWGCPARNEFEVRLAMNQKSEIRSQRSTV